ncbi:MAG: hypothetical protein VB064_03820 [Oscillospiraceae bacterium]|nr:hypothetical protein [Oscillospiraceae bacterium]
MNDQRILRYFLGGNTCRGFYSFYDSFVTLSDGTFLWIIKGGPGCGKSSFMRMVGSAAEKAGLCVEYAVCSGDPSSLDGIYIPELKTAYTDGTAPHLADTHLAAVDSAYINFGTFYDYGAISEHKAKLTGLYHSCSVNYKKAYSLLSAAGQLQTGWQDSFPSPSEIEAAEKRTDGIALREFGKRRKDKGRITYRFLSALTCNGYVSFPETMTSLCQRFYVFENRLRLGSLALQRIAQAARDSGHDVIACPDPLVPETLEAVLVPSLSLGFLSSTSALGDISEGRHIRLDTLIESARLRNIRSELRRCEKIKDALIQQAFSALNDAKTAHDQIEGIFNPNVDFNGVGKLAQEHITALGLK